MDTLTFGKYKGKTLEEIYQCDTDYLDWVEREAFSSTTRRMISVFLRQKKKEDEETKEALLSSLSTLAKNTSFSFLKEYKYIFVHGHRNTVCFDFCTHPIYNNYGFNECFHSEDWDILQISTSSTEDLEEYGEQQRKPESLPSVPTAEAPIWYAYKDNNENNPLNTKPVSLQSALMVLEKYYLKGIQQ